VPGGLNFEDCVVGGTYFKDFTIWNRSEIELFFVLNTIDLSNQNKSGQLVFCNYDTGEVLDQNHVPAYSPLRIRIIFKPTGIGEFDYTLQIENSNDSSNTIKTHIHAMVRYVLKEESLVVSSGPTLDFGDCCTGIVTRQKLVLKNISDSHLDIHFSSDEPSVVFQLNADENISQSVSSLESKVISLLDKVTEQSSVDSFTADWDTFSSRASTPISNSRKESEAASSRGSFNTFDFLGKLPLPEDITIALNEGYENEFTKIEEIILRPGAERTIEVLYRPMKDSSSFDYLSGRLVSKSFRITLSYSSSGTTVKEKKIIQCISRACTSVIEVSPMKLDFGENNIGMLKSMPLTISNISDLAAKVEVRYVSKVLNIYKGELFIPPNQSIEVKVDIYARKVNPDYHKQITIVNLLNRDNDQVVQVHSTNIDEYQLSFHSLFYRLITSVSNYLDLGSVVLNCPSIKSFTIENISKSRLVLELISNSPKELIVFEKNTSSLESRMGASLAHNRELLQSISDRKKFARPNSEAVNSLKSSKLSSKNHGIGLLRTRSVADAPLDSPVGSDYLDLASSTKDIRIKV
jgi:hypothetical protein